MAWCPRMNRMMGTDNRCFVLAMDHGFYNFAGGTDGIEDMKGIVPRLANVGPDAMLLTLGAAGFLQEIQGRQRPALVFRTDTTNVYEAPTRASLFSRSIEEAVDQAVLLDAACVVVNLMWPEGHSEVHGQCVANVGRVKRACQRLGMPMMVEPVPLKYDRKKRAYFPDGSTTRVALLVRQAVELGATVIKCLPTDNPLDFHKVVEVACGAPVLALGGGKVGDREILERTEVMLDQGAGGIVYGRNVFQHAKPERMCRALIAMVHQGASAPKALAILGGK